jgi:H+/Cl- antiporter ClcA
MASLLDFSVLGDVLGFFGAALAGWRYLFSPSYRRRVHARWQSRSQLQIAQDIAAAFAGSVLLLVVFCVIISLFIGFDWVTRLFHGTSSV